MCTNQACRQRCGQAGASGPQRKIRRVTTDKTKTFDLSASFKAYDVRGIVGQSITAEIVEAVGAAFVDVLDLEGQTVLVGGDMRPSLQTYPLTRP